MLLPKVLHGSSVMKWSKSHINSLNDIQYKIARLILQMPKYTPKEYIQSEVGFSDQLYRDMKSKLTFLHHIFNNTKKLKDSVRKEWNYNNKFINICKNYIIN